MPRARTLLGAGLMFASACARNSTPNVAVFPAGCPSGWEFLYTSHGADGGDVKGGAVCRAPRDSGRIVSRP